ncbi:MAG: hypothetical protein KDC45_14125 [Bacteroidetes bacterium]|nr:hypothetical protein [Bacteroidota bacterium]
MPVAYLPPPAIVEPAQTPPFPARCEFDLLQGEDGEKLATVAAQSWRHWDELPSRSTLTDSVDDDPSYQPIPPRRNFITKARYIFKGKATPTVYDWDME